VAPECGVGLDIVRMPPQFAAQLVHDLVEQVGQQHHEQFPLVAGEDFGFFEAAEVGLQIRVAHRNVPMPDPWLEPRQVLAGDDAQIHLLVKTGVGRVMEGTQHPGHVAQRRAFDPPFTDRRGRVTLEIQKDKVASRPEQLTQVEITVNADAPGFEVLFDKPMVMLNNPGFQSSHLLGGWRQFRRQRFGLFAEQPQVLHRQ
jgi:hypothetical protein